MTYDGFHSYTYDAEGNITAIDGGATAQYVYNALNQRVRTVVGSSVTDIGDSYEPGKVGRNSK